MLANLTQLLINPEFQSTAPAFARDSARWSKNVDNVEAYLEAGNHMADVFVPYEQALRSLPEEEFEDNKWPYDIQQ